MVVQEQFLFRMNLTCKGAFVPCKHSSDKVIMQWEQIFKLRFMERYFIYPCLHLDFHIYFQVLKKILPSAPRKFSVAMALFTRPSAGCTRSSLENSLNRWASSKALLRHVPCRTSAFAAPMDLCSRPSWSKKTSRHRPTTLSFLARSRVIRGHLLVSCWTSFFRFACCLGSCFLSLELLFDATAQLSKTTNEFTLRQCMSEEIIKCSFMIISRSGLWHHNTFLSITVDYAHYIDRVFFKTISLSTFVRS